MIGLLLATCGSILLCLVLWDVLITALGAGSSGPISPIVARSVFEVLRRLPDRAGVHRGCGPIVTASVGGTWIFLVCLGWAMIFSSSETAVLDTHENPTGSLGTFAYAGHLLSTLGGGLNEPGSQAWGVVSMLAGVTGMIVLTLAVSFIYSTTQAVAMSRSVLALSEIHGPGEKTFDYVLLPQISSLVAHVKAIPFSLYYSTVRKRRRLPEALCRLRDHPGLSSEDLARLDLLLRELPGLEGASEEGFGETFAAWARRYTLKP